MNDVLLVVALAISLALTAAFITAVIDRFLPSLGRVGVASLSASLVLILIAVVAGPTLYAVSQEPAPPGNPPYDARSFIAGVFGIALICFAIALAVSALTVTLLRRLRDQT